MTYLEQPEDILDAQLAGDAPAQPRHAQVRSLAGDPGTNPNAVLPLLVAGFACVLFALGSAATAYDNDMWWILATGREVVQNGIPYTNPFTIYDGMGVVLQQWLACVIAFSLYDAFGIVGVQALVLAQALTLTGCLYAVCRVAGRQKKGAGELYLLAVACAFAAFAAYCSVRPHLYTMILFTLVILTMELYRRDGNKLVLVALPVLACIHVNLHAAMAPFDLVIVALYLIPNIPGMLNKAGFDCGSLEFVNADYARMPVLVGLVAMAAALLANPYGLDGALYTLHSYGAADYGNYINEMGTTGFWTDYGASAMLMIALGCIALGRNGLRVNVPASLLFVASIPLSMMHTRNVWLVALFAIPLIGQALGKASLYFDEPKVLHSKAVHLVAACCLVAIAGYYVATDAWPKACAPYEVDSSSVPVAALDYMDDQVQQTGQDKAQLKVFNEFNNGGYVEWRGYKAFIDPRPELWEPEITGVDQHYYTNFVDYAQGKRVASTFTNEIDFDYLIVYTDSGMATHLNGGQTRYHVVENGDGYRLWAK